MFNKAVALLTQAFRVDVRQLRTHLLRGGVAAGVLWLLAIVHLESRGWSSPGLSFCVGLTFSTMVMLTLMGAFYFPSVITEEKEEQTLGLLRMAGVGSATLLIGKSIGRVGVILLLIAVSLPYWWLAITLGGVTTTQVAGVAISLAAHLALVSQIGTLCSVYFTTTGRACVASMIALATLFIGPPILEEILREIGVIPRGPNFVRSLYEHMAPYQLARTLQPGYAGGLFPTQVWTSTLAAAVLFGLSWFLLDRFNTYDQVAGPENKFLSRLKSLFPTFAQKRRRPRRAPEGNIGRAISWKDFRQFGGGYKWWIIRGIGFFCMGLLFTLDGWGSFWKRMGIGLILSTFWVVIAEIVFHAGHLFHRELKDQTWDSLRMLPMTTAGLVGRKILGILPVLVPTLAILFLGMALENEEGRHSLVAEIAREFDRHPVIFSTVTLYCISATLFAIYLTCYCGLKINPWLGTVLAAALFGFVVFSTFFCCFEVFKMDNNDAAGLVFLFGAMLNLAITLGLHFPISHILNGQNLG
jgi:hypothetical protein